MSGRLGKEDRLGCVICLCAKDFCSWDDMFRLLLLSQQI